MMVMSQQAGKKKGRTFHARKLFCSVDIEWCRVNRLAMTDIVSMKMGFGKNDLEGNMGKIKI